MGTLSEEEKRELREVAASTEIRNEFRVLREQSLQHRSFDLDEFIRFLTVASRLSPGTRRLRRFIHYTNVKL
jgi:hypothetical protein